MFRGAVGHAVGAYGALGSHVLCVTPIAHNVELQRHNVYTNFSAFDGLTRDILTTTLCIVSSSA